MNKKRGKCYSLKQWLAIGGKMADIENATASFSVTGSISGMRRMCYGYSCDLVRFNGYWYKVND